MTAYFVQVSILAFYVNLLLMLLLINLLMLYYWCLITAYFVNVSMLAYFFCYQFTLIYLYCFYLLVLLWCLMAGYFVHVSTLAEVREQVLKYIPVIARPLVMYKNYHPITWTNFYADVAVSKKHLIKDSLFFIR